MEIKAKEIAEKYGAGLRWLNASLRARYIVFWAAALVCLLLWAVVFTRLPSLYIGRTLLLVEVPYSAQGDRILRDEVEILRSRIMARRVVERLNLMSDPEFNRRFDYTDDRTAQNFKKLSVYGGALEKLPEDAAGMDAVVSRFLKALDVRLIKDSNVIEIKFKSSAANKAALITNSLADLYLEQRFDEKFEAVQQFTGELEGRLDELKEAARLAEEDVAEYRRAHNIDGGDVVDDAGMPAGLLVLYERLEGAQIELAEQQALLKRVQSAQEPSAMPRAVSSPLYKELQERRASLEADLARLSLRYGDKHPKIIELRTAIKEVQGVFKVARAKAVRAIEGEIRDVEEGVRSLEAEIDAIKERNGQDADHAAELKSLEREAEAARLVFDAFLETYQGKAEQDIAAQPVNHFTARVLSYAVSASDPAYPNVFKWWLGGLFISALAGVCAVVLFEYFDRSVRNAADIEARFSAPCYGLIPFVDLGSKKEMADYVISKPSSALAESVRTLRTVIGLRAGVGRKKPKVLTITSSLSGEGKSALSIWLGRLSAKSEEKVIIIDADLRGADLHEYAGQENDATLVDYLTDRKELSDVIQKTDASNVHMIYGRNVPNSALDLVSTEKMAKIVERLRKAYDLVIINAPACLGVSDAQVLGSLSDHVMYVVKWASTADDVVEGGVKQFIDMEGVSRCFVLTHVDMKRYEKYYGQYSECYND